MCVQWSLLNQVLSVLAFSRSLRARVCLGCLRTYVLACLTGPLAYVLIYRVRGVRPCLTCLLVFYPSVLIYLTSLSACVCACVCVCVCVCVCFLLFHREGFFRLQDVWNISEGYRSTMLCCEYHPRCFCQVPSSPFLKMSILHLRRRNSSMSTDWRERIWDIWLAKRLYIFM